MGSLPMTRLRVWLRPDGATDDEVNNGEVELEERVLVIWNADKIVAEGPIGRLGLIEQPMALMTGWAWASLKRTGGGDVGPLEEFLYRRCIELEPLDDDETIPPTPPALDTGLRPD